AVDPTYPLYPLACFLGAAMLLLVLFTGFIRQNWNLGVAFLCFWLFFENVGNGINTIIWSSNANIKLYIYCDIFTHIQLITFVVKPMATLIITRRLYLITSLRSVELSDKPAKRRNLVIEWTLGLGIPVLVAGPLYYIVQAHRFVVAAGFGCGSTTDFSILGILLTTSWAVTPSLVSITIYYRESVIWILYHQKRDMSEFLQSNNSISRTNYFRIFALASIDVVLTLPIGITTIVLAVMEVLSQLSPPLYAGWNTLHHGDWEPVGITYATLKEDGTSSVVEHFFSQWTSPTLSYVVFGLFGMTAEARTSY
ncbi:fungal pheromone STE3G-protein-coupled receptor, partial [Peniophora sp. CONT]